MQLAWIQDSMLTDPREDNHLNKRVRQKLLFQESKIKGKDPIGLNVECGLRVWKMPRNLHAKRPATQCKAKHKIDNMLWNKLVV